MAFEFVLMVAVAAFLVYSVLMRQVSDDEMARALLKSADGARKVGDGVEGVYSGLTFSWKPVPHERKDDRGPPPRRLAFRTTETPLSLRPRRPIDPPGVTGDAAFDEAVHVEDHAPPRGVARLDAAARKATRRALDAGARCVQGTWQIDDTSADRLDLLLPAMADATRALRADRRTPAEQLAARIRDEERASIRLAAFRALTELGPPPPDLVALLAASPSPELRHAAAAASGDVATMQALLVDSTRVWRLEAARWLLQRDPGITEAIEDALIAALDLPEHAAEAGRWLAERGTDRAARMLADRTDAASQGAIGAIRDRLADRLVGALSLVEPTAGRGDLSLAPTRSGQVE